MNIGEWQYEDDELMDMAAKEFAAAGESLHEMVFSSSKLWILVGQLQLALRHPNNTGPTAEWARHFIELIAEDIAPEGSARAELLKRGWPENQKGD